MLSHVYGESSIIWRCAREVNFFINFINFSINFINFFIWTWLGSIFKMFAQNWDDWTEIKTIKDLMNDY